MKILYVSAFALAGMVISALVVGVIYYFWRRFLARRRYGEDILKDKISILVQPFFWVAATCIAFGGAIFSVDNATKTLEASKQLASLQFRPFLSLREGQFLVGDASSEARDKPCSIRFLISNSGKAPATNISRDLKISFRSRTGAGVVLTTHPEHSGDVRIPSLGRIFAISPGDQREMRVDLLIDKSDADRLFSNQEAFQIHALIEYSTPGFDKQWFYELTGINHGTALIVLDERLD